MGKTAGPKGPGPGTGLPQGSAPLGSGPESRALLTPCPAPVPASLSADKLVKCEGISLLAQNPSWLLLALLALPVLQAADFLSL